VGLVGLIALLGLRHARLIRSSRAELDLPRRVRRSLPAEVAGGLVLIVLGATLGATVPARGPQFGPKPVMSPSTVTSTSEDLIIRVSLQPNRPGRNLLAVDVLNTRRPAPAPIGNVTVTIQPQASQGQPTQSPSAATVVKTSRVTESRWDGGAVNLGLGSLTVGVAVARPNYVPARAVMPWSVNGPDVWRQPVVLSTAHVAPIVNGAAIAIVVLTLAALVVSTLVARRRRRLRASAGPVSAGPASAGRDPIADVADRLDQVAAEFAPEPAYVHIDDIAARVE
jgi:hypothetical protein